MGFDLVLYNKKAAPADIGAFQEWMDSITDWNEDLDYNNPDNAMPELKAAFMEIIKEFPPMNGPLAPSDDKIDEDPDLESRLVDYSIAKDLIYASIAFSVAVDAGMTFFEVAEEHGLGVFDPQAGEFLSSEF